MVALFRQNQGARPVREAQRRARPRLPVVSVRASEVRLLNSQTRALQPARVPSISAAHCRPFLRALGAAGIDARRELMLLGIRDPDDGAESQRLSFAQFIAFLRRVELLVPNRELGLSAGQGLRLTELGLFGLLLRSSDDGQAALQYHQKYGNAVQEVLPCEVSLQDDATVCRPPIGIPRSRFFSQYFCASTLSFARQVQAGVEPLEVHLSYPAPNDLREHVRVLGTHLRFDAREDAVVFPEYQLSRSLEHRDPDVAAVLERHVAALVATQDAAGDDLSARARKLIATQLQRGPTTMPELARALGLSERTLRRQLEQLGSSYQGLLDDARHERVLQYMREGLSGPEVALKLGFKDASAFRRAFRRWTGRNWSEYRRDG
jgi:AraC-like DNA-binding protein